MKRPAYLRTGLRRSRVHFFNTQFNIALGYSSSLVVCLFFFFFNAFLASEQIGKESFQAYYSELKLVPLSISKLDLYQNFVNLNHLLQQVS